MNDITRLNITNNSKPCYDIVYSDSYDQLEEEFRALDPEKKRKAFIVSDSKVASIYLDEITEHASRCFASVSSYVFPEGEASKNLDVVRQIYTKLIEERYDRKSLLIALGGGVTGDMTGFTAATFLRGVDFIQIPTSLLADVDSSIGGKTGVDFDSYKNMVGAFHMPKLVYINTSSINTLSEKQFFSGMGEVVKSALIRDPELFDWLEANASKITKLSSEELQYVIYRCNIMKKNVVEEDPKEITGVRALLNLGHTLGHAIEKYMNFQFLHGECVFIGTILASYISYKKGFLSEADHIRIKKLICENMKLPKLPADVDVDAIVSFTKNDKKVEGNSIKFILLKGIGEAFISTDVSFEDMKESLEHYIKEQQ